MRLRKQMAFVLVVLGLGFSVWGQTATLTVTSYSDAVRFAAQGSVKELRVEVLSLAGRKVFDSGPVLGGALDWKMFNLQGQPVASGVYLYSVTVKDEFGNVTKKLGKLALVRGKAGQVAPPLTLLSGPTVGEVAQNPRLQPLGGPDFGSATVVGGHLNIVPSFVGAGAWGVGDGKAPQLVFGDSFTTYVTLQWFSAADYGLVQTYIAGVASGALALQAGGGNVGIGTSSPTEQLQITGNLRLPPTTATTGIIMSGGNRFIHNFGLDNFFAGVNAGNLTMTGFGGNTAVGSFALFGNTTGFSNTAVGLSALFSNTTGDANTAVGRSALVSNTTGGTNTAVGLNALLSNTTGSVNTAVGVEALFSNTTGNANTAVGINALFSNTTGFSNTAVGVSALVSNTTGGLNTAIGRDADVSAGGLTNATAIGAGAIVDASNKVRIGNTSVTVIEGQVPFTSVSDKTKKENFLPLNGREVLQKLSLVPVHSWNFIGQDSKKFRHYGPNAQEFFAAFGQDRLGTIGSPTTLTSGDVDGILMVSVQTLYELNLEKDKKIEQLENRIEKLEKLVQALTGKK